MVLLVLSPIWALASTGDPAQLRFVRQLDRMMVKLAPSSAHASKTIRREYRQHVDLLVLPRYKSMTRALSTGGLVPLPGRPEDFNLRPRVEGSSPIAEKDLGNQASYIAARPATIGALLEIAAQVKSGPIEITSMVRHTEYQNSLRATNANAVTSIPMHTLGLAVDISLVNTPIERVYEIRDVLVRMQRRGDILFIGERRQLVFHVVPHPARLGYFTEVYAHAAARAAGYGDLYAAPVRGAVAPLAEAAVATEVIGIRPTDEYAEEWWADDGARADLVVAVTAPTLAPAPVALSPQPAAAKPARSFLGRLTARAVAVLEGVVSAARALLR